MSLKFWGNPSPNSWLYNTQSPRKEEYGATGELKILRSILKRDFRGEVIVKPYKCTTDGSQNIDNRCRLIKGVIPLLKYAETLTRKSKTKKM